MKRFLATLLVAVCLCGVSYAGSMSGRVAPVEVRASAIITNASVLSTTFSMPSNTEAIWCYAELDLTGATNAIVTPACAVTSTPASIAAASYYRMNDYAKTYTSSGNYAFRVPTKDIGGNYFGIAIIGSGTLTSTTAVLKYKPEVWLDTVKDGRP